MWKPTVARRRRWCLHRPLLPKSCRGRAPTLAREAWSSHRTGSGYGRQLDFEHRCGAARMAEQVEAVGHGDRDVVGHRGRLQSGQVFGRFTGGVAQQVTGALQGVPAGRLVACSGVAHRLAQRGESQRARGDTGKVLCGTRQSDDLFGGSVGVEGEQRLAGQDVRREAGALGAQGPVAGPRRPPARSGEVPRLLEHLAGIDRVVRCHGQQLGRPPRACGLDHTPDSVGLADQHRKGELRADLLAHGPDRGE